MELLKVDNDFANSKGPPMGDESSDFQTAPPFISPTAWQVLFIGGDALWFEQIKHDLACLQPCWRLLHSEDVAAAMSRMLKIKRLDAVVIDGRVSGARDFIKSLITAGDQTLRLLRCDMSDRHVVDSWKGLGIPMVTSYGDASRIAASLLRISRLRAWTADPGIQRLLPQVRKLPTAPDLYHRVSDELSSPNASLDAVVRLICQDPVISAKMLQIVNSALYAASREITDMLDAAMLLGSERIKSLILLGGIFTQFDDAKGGAASIQTLLTHSIKVGGFARAIALSETKNSRTAEAAYTAGVLHDVGKLILAGNLPDQFARMRALVRDQKICPQDAERDIFGVSHARFGACLLAAWGLPLPTLEAIAWHHEPLQSPDTSFSLLTAVHAANVFAHDTDPQAEHGCGRPCAVVDERYLDAIGLAGHCGVWREACGLSPD